MKLICLCSILVTVGTRIESDDDELRGKTNMQLAAESNGTYADEGDTLDADSDSQEKEGGADGDVVYIKSAAWNKFVHSARASGKGHRALMSDCGRQHNYPNCYFRLEQEVSGQHMYIKTSDKELFLHAYGGNKRGANITDHPCPKYNNYANCQWALEPSPTRPGFFYIKAKNSNLYMHSFEPVPGLDFFYKMHPFVFGINLQHCRKRQDNPYCQWQFQPYCMDESTKCGGWKNQGYCKSKWCYTRCRKTCGGCNGGARGFWEQTASIWNGPVSFTQTTIITKGNTQTKSKTVGNTVAATVSASLEFKGIGGVSSELTSTASKSVSKSLAQSVSTSISGSIQNACAKKSGKHTWAYRWVVQSGDTEVKTNSFRCHYTSNNREQAPMCPNGFCKDSNCQACLPWKIPNMDMQRMRTLEATGCPNPALALPPWWGKYFAGKSAGDEFFQMEAWCKYALAGATRDTNKLEICCGKGKTCITNSCSKQTQWRLTATHVGARQADNTHCYGKDGSNRVEVGNKTTLIECADAAAVHSSCGTAFEYGAKGTKNEYWCGCGKTGTANSNCRESVNANQAQKVYYIVSQASR